MNREFAQSVVATCAVALALAGCATASKDIAPTYVSPMQYQSYDCEQIAAEVQRISVRVTQLGGRLDEASTNDKLITTVGIVLFWPILFALGGTKQQEAEYARLKGEYDALQQQAVQKKCAAAVPSTTASTVPAQPASGSTAPEAAPMLVPVSAPVSAGIPAAAAPSAPPGPAAATPSKFMFNAERFAKGMGCESPVATMNAKAATSESFTIACSNRARLSVQCGDDNCREAQ